MSRLSPNQLTSREVETATAGAHSDGGNLWLVVNGNSRSWMIRFQSPTTGKRREMGIGPTRDVGLAKARKKATEARQLLRDGVDPIESRNAQKAERRKANENAFRLVAARYIEEQTPGWRDAKLAARWTSSLERLAYPAIGDLAVATIATDDVLKVLRPIWATLNHTADRVRGRIERILDYATSRGLREGDNPARRRGHLDTCFQSLDRD